MIKYKLYLAFYSSMISELRGENIFISRIMDNNVDIRF